jgi:hypothetical protein
MMMSRRTKDKITIMHLRCSNAQKKVQLVSLALQTRLTLMNLAAKAQKKLIVAAKLSRSHLPKLGLAAVAASHSCHHIDPYPHKTLDWNNFQS